VSSFSELYSTVSVAADRRKLRTHVAVRPNERHDGYNHRNLLVITQQHTAHNCTPPRTAKPYNDTQKVHLTRNLTEYLLDQRNKNLLTAGHSALQWCASVRSYDR